MIIKKTYLSLLFVCSSLFVFAQDGVPVYQDYFADNLYLIHPATAGAANYNKIRLNARLQWFDENEAPNLQALTINARIGDRSGLGAIVFNDKNGFHSQVGGYLTYAHHIKLGRGSSDLNQLSFGLSAGLIQSRLDETQFDPNDFDPVVAGIIQSSSYFNVDAGVSYYFENFSGHLTAKNLIFQNRNLFTEDLEPNNQRTYMISSAYFVNTSYGVWAFEPSFLFQWKERTGEQSIDINFKAFREVEFGRLWGGISYRRSFDGSEFLDGTEIKDQKLQFISPVVGVNYKKFTFAFMYTYQTGTVRFQSGGFYGLTVGYNFLEGTVRRWSQDMKYNGMLRPRGN